MSDDRRDPWFDLSRHTAARIALGRAGGSLRTHTLLDFRLAHARAKDAVELPFDADALARELERTLGDDATCRLATGAHDRQSYLLRPDLGRALATESRAALAGFAPRWGARDLCVIVSDGLSALAAERQAPRLLTALLPLLEARSISLYPIIVAPFARVKVADEIGEVLRARHSLVLLGERPGLSSPDSLGAYLTYRPRSTCSDADRNCVSNIRPEGLAPASAARVLRDLILESADRQLSGIALKLPS